MEREGHEEIDKTNKENVEKKGEGDKEELK